MTKKPTVSSISAFASSNNEIKLIIIPYTEEKRLDIYIKSLLIGIDFILYNQKSL